MVKLQKFSNPVEAVTAFEQSRPRVSRKWGNAFNVFNPSTSLPLTLAQYEKNLNGYLVQCGEITDAEDTVVMRWTRHTRA